MKNYVATIGLEIHAELKTASKMFCSCCNDPFSSDANTNICPICLGMPGTLPVLNKKAIEWTIKTGLALNCEIASITKWDRKNYFYPDLPKGYQISQYDMPICQKGFLEVLGRKIKITRIHLEEDTGTLKHPEGRVEVDYSLADYNRAGVPLMELVTEPDITTAQEAKLFCQNYQQILRTLKIADADMEKGQMRCEANISLREKSKLGTKVEVKNLNSFKAVEKAINYEVERQTDVLISGEKVIQETRGWDDKLNKTYVMRVKETSADYRYFPEPDLPAIRLAHGLATDKDTDITQINIEKIKKDLPELPEEKIKRYIKEFKLSENNALQISSSPKIAKYFDDIVINTKYPNDLANLIVNNHEVMDLSPKDLAELTNMIGNKKITRSSAKELIPDIKKGKNLSELIKEKGLNQISDTKELNNIIEKIISANPTIVKTIKAGKTQAIGFLVGQVMKETKGKANPELASRLIKEATGD